MYMYVHKVLHVYNVQEGHADAENISTAITIFAGISVSTICTYAVCVEYCTGTCTYML